MMSKNLYLGSALDDLLIEEGSLAEIESIAIQQVNTWLLSAGNRYEEAQQDSDGKTEED